MQGMYEKMVTTKGCLYKQNVNPVLTPKLGQIQLRFMFNYYFIYKDIQIYNLLSISSHQYLFLANIKHSYQTVNMYLDYHHYLVFYISGIS